MTSFDSTMIILSAAYVDGALKGIPEALQEHVAAVVRDSYKAGFQSGFHFARTTPETDIPTPPSAIYRPEARP